MNNPEEKEVSLEEKFTRLRGEGMEDKDIIRKIFEENLEADVGEICKITGLDPLAVGRIKGQIMRWRKKETEVPGASEVLGVGASEVPRVGETEHPDSPSPLKEGLTEREYVAFYGEPALEELKKQRLIELLDSAPGVGKATIKWISKQWQLDSNVRRDLNQLFNLLNTSGVKNEITSRICNVLQAMDDEYSFVLQRESSFDRYYRPRTLQEQGYPPRFPVSVRGFRDSQDLPRYPPSFPARDFREDPYGRFEPRYPPRYDDYGYPPPSRPEDIAKRVAEILKEKEEKESQSNAQAQAQVVTITEPLRDAEGKLVYGKDGNPVYRKVTGPMNQIGVVGQEDPELRFIRKMKEYNELNKPDKSTLTEDRVRSVIREEVGAKEEKITKEDIAKASEDAAHRVLASKEQEDKEERRHRETLQAIKDGSGAKTVEGYKADEFRLLGQSIDTLAKREPKTAKVVTEFLERVMYGPTPMAKEVEPGASDGILERINKKYIIEE